MSFLKKIFQSKKKPKPQAAPENPVPMPRTPVAESPQNGIIIILDDGFFVRHEEDIAQVRWADIYKIYCYKHECFSHDMICLVFSSTDGHPLRVSEEMAGFENLVTALWPAFPGLEEKYARWLLNGKIDDGHYTLWKQA